jgi:hypothetical protein
MVRGLRCGRRRPRFLAVAKGVTLTIDYKLTGSGRAECTISDGKSSCTVTASYLSDALGDLVLSAVVMLHWFNDLSFSFEEEPGEFRWIFTVAREKQPELLELKVLDFRYEHHGQPSRLLFQTVCSAVVFGNAVLKAASDVLAEYGEAGYKERWVEYPFPTERVDELTRLLAKYQSD